MQAELEHAREQVEELDDVWLGGAARGRRGYKRLEAVPLALQIESLPRKAKHGGSLFHPAAAFAHGVQHHRTFEMLNSRSHGLIEADDDLSWLEDPLGCGNRPP